MSLVIEDGTIKPDAQSYATVAELKAYAKLRAATVPSSDTECEVLLMKAMDYLEGLEYQGDRVRPDQPLKWPRINVMIENWPLPAQEMPRQLIQAQCALAIEVQTIDILPTKDIQDPGPVVSETVGPITTTYANTGSVRRVPAMAKAEALLRTLMRRNGLTVVRA